MLLSSLEVFIQTVKGQYNFWKLECFSKPIPGGFSLWLYYCSSAFRSIRIQIGKNILCLKTWKKSSKMNKLSILVVQ